VLPEVALEEAANRAENLLSDLAEALRALELLGSQAQKLQDLDYCSNAEGLRALGQEQWRVCRQLVRCAHVQDTCINGRRERALVPVPFTSILESQCLSDRCAGPGCGTSRRSAASTGSTPRSQPGRSSQRLVGGRPRRPRQRRLPAGGFRRPGRSGRRRHACTRSPSLGPCPLSSSLRRAGAWSGGTLPGTSRGRRWRWLRDLGDNERALAQSPPGTMRRGEGREEERAKAAQCANINETAMGEPIFTTL
jgi:hypothetical protein